MRLVKFIISRKDGKEGNFDQGKFQEQKMEMMT